ncbi:MAG: sn-glycerol-3-phosphate ABC transporter ATP-binding protein UgpC [Eubacterium sp.]|nr:sn-glycerol-3-phosphate ABC transporter ATP-binding protein UgpC [Eubacterium sp.]
MAEIEFRHVTKTFDKNVTVVKDLNLKIHDKELVMIIGPSGCGKSTTLRMLAGLETVTSGSVLVDGVDVTKLEPGKRDLSMVFQSYALYPQMNIYNNIAFALKVRGFSKEEIDKRVHEVADMLQITSLLKRRPAQVSGGQRQRVAISAAIAREAKAYLMDEPLSNLDAKLRAEMRVEIAKLHKNLESTIVYVTHDQVEAMTLADRIVVMNGGIAQQIASPMELYLNPVNTFVAGFVGSPQINFLSVRLLVKENGYVLTGDGIEIRIPEEEAHAILASPDWEKKNKGDSKLILGIRPEELKICDPSEEELPLHTEVCENLGAEELLYGFFGNTKPEQAEIAGTMQTVRTKEQTGIRPGQKVSLKADVETWKVFDPDNGRNLLYRKPEVEE